MPPLIFPWLIIVGTIAAALSLRRHSPWLRLAVSVAAIVVLTFLIWPIVGSTWDPRFSTDSGSFASLSEKMFVAAWWLLLARIAVISGQILLGINHQRHSARLLWTLWRRRSISAPA